MNSNAYSYTPQSAKGVLLPLSLSVALVVCSFALQGNVGFSLWDEGYLWYGVQRVMLGEVPILDFMAYDPGRYYWSASLMSLAGENGIMALRWSVAVFQVAGLFIGLKLLSGSVKKHNFLYLFLSAVILLLWMFPRQKLFDISLSIFLVGILTYLVSNPIPKRFFYAGIGVGLIAVFGRNHGVYGLVSVSCVMLWLSIKSGGDSHTLKKISYFSSGVTIGFLPILLMLLLVPEFDVAFIDSIRFLLDSKSTNLPLPVPWPWLVNFSDPSIGNIIRNVLVGLFFMALILFPVLSITWVSWQRFHGNKVNSVFAAAIFLSLPYAHFAYSRADINHLAQAIFPLLIGVLVMFATSTAKIKWSGIALLSLISIWTMHHYHPGWKCYTRITCKDVEISGNNLRVNQYTYAEINLLRDLSERYAKDNNNLIVYPYWPGAYALLERKSPVWEIYALFPRPRSFESDEIERIIKADPSFVFIYEKRLDGKEETLFSNTHPLTSQYIRKNYLRLTDSLKPAHQIYIRSELIDK